MAGVVDFGLYDALRGRDDFAQQRQDAALNANYIGQLQKQSADKLAAEQLAQQGVIEHLNAANQAVQQALPGDKERVQDFVSQQKQPLVESIGKYGGDIDKWRENGGNFELQKYEDRLQNGTDERGVNPIATSVTNMNAARLAIADKKSGLEYRSNPDGTPFDLNQSIQDLKNGKINTISYPGAYKPTKYNINDLENRYGANPNIRQGITKPEVIANMSEQGLDPEQIRKDLPKFFDPSGKSLFYHKYDHITPEQRLNMKKMQIEIMNMENKNAFDDAKEQVAGNKLDQVQNVLQGKNFTDFNPVTGNLEDLQIPAGSKVNTDLAGTMITANLPTYKQGKDGKYLQTGVKTTKVPIKEVVQYPDGEQVIRIEDNGKIYKIPLTTQNAFSTIIEPYAKNEGNTNEMLRAALKKKIWVHNGYNWGEPSSQNEQGQPTSPSAETESNSSSKIPLHFNIETQTWTR